ncbi:D-sedoheptulose-7-phosphate isomerase [Candidatus Puniceispirillum marinum]|uniref:Phosphoheptose isomerase n=1 Tax=Puniceispirillum marinum (strain IMCC1322) TaxID=488538 RepID=D5BUG8_PUNMI|nr:SIS domain-containing protein [Candidatus Puniceispirillum marinum]ADE39915.1 phosphoheptose isomerase [Candidatus Puniceispirillum marinum IMCC1322]
MAYPTGTDIKAVLLESAAVKTATANMYADAVIDAALMIADTLAQGGKLMLCGNGGSAGDAQHIAAEFVATLDHRRPRGGLAALALTTDTSFITAYANDFGFEGIFQRQVEALGREGDVLLGISTSGNSANVAAAMDSARGSGIKTIGFTGEGGGKLAPLSDMLFAVPSRKTMHIQEAHIALGHVLTMAVEQIMGY